MATTWILIADAARARLLSSEPDAEPVEVAAFTHPVARQPARAVKGGPLPVTHDRFGAARHAIEPRTKFKDVEAARFARTLCARLDRGRRQHEFEGLVLLAPARFLGLLHATMNKHLRALVVSEASKDLVTAPHAALVAQLAEVQREPARSEMP